MLVLMRKLVLGQNTAKQNSHKETLKNGGKSLNLVMDRYLVKHLFMLNN